MNEKLNFNVFFSKMGFFSKIVLIVQIFLRNVRILKKKLRIGLKNVRIVRIFKKIVRIVRISSENVRICSKNFWPPCNYKIFICLGFITQKTSSLPIRNENTLYDPFIK